jgi:hypothetical protein
MSLGMHQQHVLERLVEVRDRVAHGWPSIAIALAGSPTNTAQERLRAAGTGAPLHETGAEVLRDALKRTEAAQALWAGLPVPLAPAGTPCALDLREHLSHARRCAEFGLAWEDPSGLSRTKAVCVLQLAVVLLSWDMQVYRADFAAQEAQRALEVERQQRAAIAARRIWGGQDTKKPALVPAGPRSLRDLAHVSDAFDQWDDERET